MSWDRATPLEARADALAAASAATATLGVIRHAVQTQVAVLSFDEAFLLAAFLFIVAAPLLIGLKLLLARKSGLQVERIEELRLIPIQSPHHHPSPAPVS